VVNFACAAFSGISAGSCLSEECRKRHSGGDTAKDGTGAAPPSKFSTSKLQLRILLGFLPAARPISLVQTPKTGYHFPITGRKHKSDIH
jgi:hypothetical protein